MDYRELNVELHLVHCNTTKMKGVIIQKSIHRFDALNKFLIYVVLPLPPTKKIPVKPIMPKRCNESIVKNAKDRTPKVR